jgi:hypothetical protein
MAVTKKKPAAEPVLSEKARAVAMLVEFKRSASTQQLIVVSESEADGKYQTPILLIRTITEEAKRRPWDVRIPPESKKPQSAERASEYLEYFSRWLSAIISADSWIIQPNPISVEVTAQDLSELATMRAPGGMLQRIAAISAKREEAAKEAAK